MGSPDHHAKLHGLWLTALGLVELCVALGYFANGAYRLLVAAVMVGLGFPPILLAAAVLGLVYLASAIAPIVGIVGFRWPLPGRVALVLAPLAIAAAAHGTAIALGIPGVGAPEPAPPPADCRPSTADPSSRLRPCDPTRPDGGEMLAGNCPTGYTCREPVGRQGAPACYIGCFHDCMCPPPARCVNAGCQWPGDPLP